MFPFVVIFHYRSWRFLFLLTLVGAQWSAVGALKPSESDGFFASTNISRFKITIAPDGVEKLKKDPHNYVSASVNIDDHFQYTNVAVHIKGGAGSLRPFDDKPALTLSFSKYAETKFMGMRKLHLNNSVQDPSFMTENICGQLFREAGVPAPRVANARVWVNGRDLGFYVLVEGFSKDFLKRWFTDNSGHLYDGGFVQDIDQKKQDVNAKVTNDQSDLKALADASREPDPQKRWERLEKLLDVDRFISFTVMEIMTSHWDGYTVNRNNYRIYYDVDIGKILFFPHGMDQMFGNRYNLFRPPLNGMVSAGLMSTPEGARRYRERAGFLFTNVFRLESLTNQVSQLEARFLPVLKAYNPNAANDLAGQAAGLRDRIRARWFEFQKQMDQPDPQPIKFDASGVAKVILPWEQKIDAGDPQLNLPKVGEGKQLHIAAGKQECVASWRGRIVLPPGKYVFSGRVHTAGVVPRKDESGTGAGLRVSGLKRENKLAGDADWSALEFPMEITDLSTELELVCELRASKGEVWFDPATFRIVRK